MLERPIELYLRDEIRLLGGEMEKFVSPGVRGRPDDIVSWPANKPSRLWSPIHGDFVINAAWCEFIETKRPKGGRLSVLQKKDHARRRKMGFLVHVIWTMEQAEAYLISRGKKIAYEVGDKVRGADGILYECTGVYRGKKK